MFNEAQLSQEDLVEFRARQIPLAHSLRELEQAIEGYYARDQAIWNGYRLTRLLRRWKRVDDPMDKVSWNNIKDAIVLDLGSGSSRDAVFRPYFSRLCAINGAEVVAIDAGQFTGWDRRLFLSVTADIVELVVNKKLTDIPEIAGKRFDIIQGRRFVGVDSAPDLLDGYRRTTGDYKLGLEDVEPMLIQQCAPLLKEGGILDLELLDYRGDLFHRKVNGALVEEVD